MPVTGLSDFRTAGLSVIHNFPKDRQSVRIFTLHQNSPCGSLRHFPTYLFALFLALTVIYGCTARRLQPGQVLVKKVIIRCDSSEVSRDDMYSYVKQKPNRKLFGVNGIHFLRRSKLKFPKAAFHRRKIRRNGKKVNNPRHYTQRDSTAIGRRNLKADGSGYPLYLHIYNLVNPAREKKRKDKRDKRYEAKKLRRENTVTIFGKKRKPPKRRKTMGEFLYDIGEPPVILDTTKTNRSARQVELYLENKGYFNSTVTDTLIYPFFQRKRKKKAIVCYIVRPAPVYTIRNVKWVIRDSSLIPDIFAGPDNISLVKTGEHYDVDVFEAERTRITRKLRNNGYYLFSKDYIRFSADTTAGTHQVDIKIIVSKQQVKTSDTSLVEVSHQKFYVKRVYVRNVFDVTHVHDTALHFDSVATFRSIVFLRNLDTTAAGWPREPELRYKPEMLAPRILFYPLADSVWRQIQTEETYRQLTSLRVFRQVLIEPKADTANGTLDIMITLVPIPKQSFGTQGEVTTTGGYLGSNASVSYTNNNLARGAEFLEFKVRGGTEAQQPIAGADDDNSSGQLPFNTIEVGADLTLNFPREFFPFQVLVAQNKPEERRITKERKTVFASSASYLRRVDYDRSLGNLSYGYTFRHMKYNRFGIYPLEINVVKVNPGPGLQAILANGDPLLNYRFTDHLIQDCRLSFTRSTNMQKRKSYFVKIDLESAGNLMRWGYSLSNAVPDDQGSYRIAGIPFAQYGRLFMDYHFYRKLGEHQMLVLRMAYGLGVPFSNFPTMPLEKSFYGGGANGIRAWEARTLGPGSYITPAEQKYSQFGDVQIEYNIELRFRITKTLEGALFADGGNIWLLKKDDNRVGAEFNPQTFYNDFAFGPGFGVRYNLGFFVIRLDLAFKVRDPAQPYGERWYVGQRTLGSNLNFGIGYPF
jgi:outer membrane protein assembly factor BamA